MLSAQGKKMNKTFPHQEDRRKRFKESRDHRKIREAREQCGLERPWNLVPKKYEALVSDKDIGVCISYQLLKRTLSPKLRGL